MTVSALVIAPGANAAIVFSETFDGPTLDPSKWVVSALRGDPNSPYYGTNHPATLSFAGGRLAVAVPGGANGSQGIPDGSRLQPNVAVAGDFEITLRADEALRAAIGGYPDNSGFSLVAGDVSITIGGNYSGGSPTHRIVGYNGAANCINNQTLSTALLYAAEFKISRLASAVTIAYRLNGGSWATLSCGTYAASFTPWIDFYSGDGGGTIQNGRFTASVDDFSVSTTQQASPIVTNPAIGVFTGGINLTAKIDSASVSGVVITVTRPSGTFSGNGVLRLCRGEGNACETVVDAPYTSGAASVTFPAVTPRLRRQDFYFVQRYDAVTIGGLDPNMRSAQMIVIADNAEAGRVNAVETGRGLAGRICGLASDGQLRCWSSASPTTPTVYSGFPASLSKISFGNGEACVLASGAVWCAGNNDVGQLGDGSTTARAAPVRVVGLPAVITDITTGRNTSCALSAGSAWCWGFNFYGEATGGVSPNSPISVLSPTLVPSLGTDNVKIVLGDFYGCALKASGAVLCWGINGNGSLGNGVGLDTGTIYPATAVAGIVASTLATHPEAQHVCVTKADYSVWCWGMNGYAQLGRGSASAKQWQPAKATAFTQSAKSMAFARNATCIITLGDAVACVGDNSGGRLGSDDAIDPQTDTGYLSYTSVATIVQGVSGSVTSASAGDGGVCVSLTDGSVRCSGSGPKGDGSTNASYHPVKGVGFGPTQTALPAPTFGTFSRTGDTLTFSYRDGLTSADSAVTDHRWACVSSNGSGVSVGGNIRANEAAGTNHTVSAKIERQGMWSCQVMYRTANGYSPWSAWVQITTRPTVVPTMVSAVYDGSYGTLVFTDNLPATKGPIIGLSAVCSVGYGAYVASGTPGCQSGDTICTAFPVVMEPAGTRHTIRLPLPPGSAGVSQVYCRAGYNTYDGPSENAMAEFLLTATPTPPPTINSGRVIGNTGTLTFSDNLPASAGTVSTSVWSCVRTRDNATFSGAVTINKPAGGTHTISLPLNSSDYQQNPDSYACTVRVATTGLAGPFSTPYTIGPNSPPVISAFSFSVANGVISGAFNITDPDGDLVKNLMVYFGTSARGTDCSSGVLGSWDVPRAGGTINFTASATNVGCAALTSSATTIYGFVRGSDANGRDATIVDAQASNTPWVPPLPPTANDTYRIDFVSAPTTLNVDQAVDITMRLVDWNSTTVTAFRGRVCISIDVTNLLASFIGDEADNHGTACRIVVFSNGVGRIRAFRMHAPGTATILARAELPSTLAGAAVGSDANFLKAAAVTSQAAKTATGTLTVTAGGISSKSVDINVAPCNELTLALQSWRLGMSAFCADLANGTVTARAVDNESGSSYPLSYGSVQAGWLHGFLPVSTYVVRFYRGGSTTAKQAVKQPLVVNLSVDRTRTARPEHLPYEAPLGRRPVMLIHGVFDSTAAGGSSLAVSGDSGAIGFDVPFMPAQVCSAWYRYESGFVPAACGDLRKPEGAWPMTTLVTPSSTNWLRLEQLVQGMNPNFYVVPVNYDWRMKPQDSAAAYLATAIAEAKRVTGSPVVDIVAHSMGGLVALSYVQRSSDVDRLVMIGTPIGGAVNAFGLMELADPINLDQRLSDKASFAKRIPNVYSWIIQNVMAQQRSTGIINFNNGVDGEGFQNTYATAFSTVASRAPIFRELVPSGFSLYPDSATLKFLKTDRAVSSANYYWWSRRVGSDNILLDGLGGQKRWGDRGIGRPDFTGLNGGDGLVNRAQCVQSSSPRATISAGFKTSVYLFLSRQNQSTLRSLSYPTALDDSTNPMRQNLAMNQFVDSPSNWGLGDGTVPLDGQRAALQAYLQLNTLTADICSKVGDTGGNHTDMPGNAQAQSYVRNILTGLGGGAGLTSAAPTAAETAVKAASTPSAQFSVAYANPAGSLSLSDVTAGTNFVVTANGVTGTLIGASGTNSEGRVAASVTNPAGTSFAVQLSGGVTEGTALRRVQFDAVGTIGETHDQRWLLVDKQTQHSFTLAFASAAANPLTVTHAAPTAPTWVRTQPGAVSTLVKWQQPADASIVRYEIHTRRANEEVWRLDAIVASSLTQNALPFGASSSTQPERLITVVAVNASGVRSRVADIASNVLVLTPEFSFDALAVVPPSTVANSNSSMGKNNAPIAISVTGGQYSVNGGSWLTTPGTLQPYDSVQLRGTAPATLDATQAVVFTANGVPYTFTVKAANAIACKRPTRGLADSAPFIRFLDGLTGVAMVTGLVPAAESTTVAATNLENYFMDNLTAYDFNGDGFMSAEVDGLLYARYALGFRGTGLFAGIEVGTTRTTAQIETSLAACQ